jgi:hypothetical protein
VKRQQIPLFLIVMALGIALIAAAYYKGKDLPDYEGWLEAVEVVTPSIAQIDPGALPPVSVYRLENILAAKAPLAEALVGKDAGSVVAERIRFLSERKLSYMDGVARKLPPTVLDRGAMPAGPGEAVVGYDLRDSFGGEITIEGRSFKVVGVLVPELTLFYGRVLADRPDPAPEQALVSYVFVSPQALDRPAIKTNLEELFPADKHPLFAYSPRLGRNFYLLTLLGLAGLLFGGLGLLTLLLCSLGGLKGGVGRWIGPPARVISERLRQLLLLQFLYYGLVLVVMLLAFDQHGLQSALMENVRSEVQGPGLLGFAGQAYASGNIPYAAAVTTLINSIVGALLFITIPSLIVPGIGVLLGLFRAGIWGLLPAPTSLRMASVMRAQAGTLLLEGAAYVVAMFFGLQVLLYLLRKGKPLKESYLEALKLNLLGFLLVLGILVIAGIYEAIAVILQM